MKPFTQYDVQTQRSMQFSPASYVNVYVFAPTEIKTVTVPVDAHAVAFSSTGNYFVNFNGHTASGSGRTDGTGDELNPTTRYLDSSITSFSIYAPDTIILSVAFYGLQ